MIKKVNSNFFSWKPIHFANKVCYFTSKSLYRCQSKCGRFILKYCCKMFLLCRIHSYSRTLNVGAKENAKNVNLYVVYIYICSEWMLNARQINQNFICGIEMKFFHQRNRHQHTVVVLTTRLSTIFFPTNQCLYLNCTQQNGHQITTETQIFIKKWKLEQHNNQMKEFWVQYLKFKIIRP